MKDLEKKGELTEDDITDADKEIQELTSQFIEDLDSALSAKEKDLLTI